MTTPPTFPDPAQQPPHGQQPYPQQPPYGAPLSPQPMYVVQQQPPTSGMAVASMIFGILGLVSGCCTFGVFSIVAVICGHAALADIKQTGKRGDGMAKAGLIMGYVIFLPAVFLSFWAVVGAGMETINPSTP